MEDNFTNFQQADLQYKKLQEGNARAYDENSKKRLCDLVQKKFTTTIIGSLDSIEKLFGYLWASGIPQDELNEREEKFRILWQELREEILNKGHNQARACLHEINNYKVHLEKKQFYFQPRKEGVSHE